MPIRDAALGDGLAQVDWPARLEVLTRHPTVVLDCAHNVASAEALRDALLSSFPTAGKRFLVFAVSRDKDYTGMLHILEPLFDEIVMTRFEKNPRYVQPEHLRAALGDPADLTRRHPPPARGAAIPSGML